MTSAPVADTVKKPSLVNEPVIAKLPESVRIAPATISMVEGVTTKDESMKTIPPIVTLAAATSKLNVVAVEPTMVANELVIVYALSPIRTSPEKEADSVISWSRLADASKEQESTSNAWDFAVMFALVALTVRDFPGSTAVQIRWHQVRTGRYPWRMHDQWIDIRPPYL